MPLAFYDLKNVQTVRITSMPQETVRAQSFSFDSPALKEVLLFNDAHGWKGQAQPGAYQGKFLSSYFFFTEADFIFPLFLIDASISIISFDDSSCLCLLGFPKGSRLRVIESETIAKEVYIGVLTGGGILDIPGKT